MSKLKEFSAREDIVISPRRHLIDALGGDGTGPVRPSAHRYHHQDGGSAEPVLHLLVDLGGYATAMSGPAMACAIGWALHCPPLVLFSLITVGYSANALGGAGGPLAVLIIAIVAAELGKAVSKETTVDILVTPLVTILLRASGFPCSSPPPSAQPQVRWAPLLCGLPSRLRWSWAFWCRSSWAWH